MPTFKCTIVMIRSLTSKWKQQIYYDFDKNVTKNVLFEVIKVTENIGIKVDDIVSDMRGSNQSLWKNLFAAGVQRCLPRKTSPHLTLRNIVLAETQNLEWCRWGVPTKFALLWLLNCNIFAQLNYKLRKKHILLTKITSHK